ncbi:MAG: hypothetical protein JO097_02055 [Acidobacteriaceae bacterium]|nr:hypothetical protein [Acidobacteriaceae bacterium]MBV9764949.1 hypothetical protein [Acidobacteriaceae bacterium]
MENPLNLPPELLRQADAIFAALIANAEILEQGRGHGLRFGISPLGAVMLAEKYGDAGKRAGRQLSRTPLLKSTLYETEEKRGCSTAL